MQKHVSLKSLVDISWYEKWNSRENKSWDVALHPSGWLDPSNPSTIYAALCFARNQYELHGIKMCFVTFDQPLYVKAVKIVAASTDLGNVVVRLSGSIFICLTWVQSNSSWVAVDSKVCGKLFIPLYQWYTWHTYSASLTSAALDAMLLLTHEHLNDEDQRKRLCLLHALLINTDYSNVDVLEDTAIHELRKTISNARSFLEWKLYRSNKISWDCSNRPVAWLVVEE